MTNQGTAHEIPVDGAGVPITSGPLSAGYQNVPMAFGFSNYDKRPPFTYWVIQRMLQDDQVSLALKAAKGPVRKATIVVRSANPEIREYVAQTLADVWRSGMEKLLSCYEFGYAAAEVVWDRRGRAIVYKGVRDFHPADVRPLSANGKLCGFRVRGGLNKWSNLQQHRAQAGKKPQSGTLDLLGCRAIWATHGANHGNVFGISRLYPAYAAWDAKWSKGGAIESLNKWYYRYAFHGLVVRYPVKEYGISGEDGGVELLSARDLAKEIGDKYRNGSSISLPNTVDKKTGQKEWEVEFPQASAPQHNMLEWVADLDKRIARGIGIFPELMEASSSTGSLAGRRVPERAFYASEEGRLWELLEAVREQIVNPGLLMTFGPGADNEYQIAEVVVAPKQDGGEGGGEDAGGEEAGAGPEGSAPQGSSGPSQAEGSAPQLPGGIRLSRYDIACSGGRLIRHTSTSLSVVRSLHRSEAFKSPLDIMADLAWASGKRLLKLLALRLRTTAAKWWQGDRSRLEKRLAAVSRSMAQRFHTALWQAQAAAYLAGAGDAAKNLEVGEEAGAGLAGGSAGGFAGGSAGGASPSEIAERLHGGNRAVGSDREPTSVGFSQDDPIGNPPDDGSGGTPIPPDVPSGDLIDDMFGDDPELVYPGLDAAVDNVRRRVPMTREDFTRLTDTARQAAFTVAGLDDEAAVETVQGALAETLAEGASLDDFAQRVQATPFMSAAHLETVFRTNAMSAFAAGQQDLMRHPIISSAFPYIAYDATLDTRVRPTHAEMMFAGLLVNGQPSNIYRADDPIWDTWLPPNGYRCRCRVTYLTLEQAARRGVEEAILWRDTGVPPAMPFRANVAALPDDGFAARPAIGPPAVALSMLAVASRSTVKSKTPPGMRWVTINGSHLLIDQHGNIAKGGGGKLHLADFGRHVSEFADEKPKPDHHSTLRDTLRAALPPGELVLMRDLRKLPAFAHLSKEDFDREIHAAVSGDENFTLHGHDHPMLRPEAERATFLKGPNDVPGAREYYVGISRRDDRKG